MASKEPKWRVIDVPLMYVIIIMVAVFLICVKHFVCLNKLQAVTREITPFSR